MGASGENGGRERNEVKALAPPIIYPIARMSTPSPRARSMATRSRVT